ncbi:branched-chain amino acid ABC transporter permease [Pollutimonas bauzanensis]|uniref:Branched-chain amino acid transport system permease protein n=1 Tax=Pollutimonas bauzanensis TaxID=658167 RepID=A0A1M5MIR1_9BURK|nr:branched-chain amino acid ABC transporter permease [Pollutimonas bauzanensis]SHG77354.1 branched-chain amino acid transport system permease protein [Pollutimonas bauzanensis]
MQKNNLVNRIGSSELIALAAMLLALVLPAITTDAAAVSVLTQFMIATMGALSVYIMLRMDLMFFAVPAFMAIGGYSAAILSAHHDITDLFILTVTAFGLPFLLAIPLGLLVLRMKGVYFVLVTFVLAEIMPLVLFETPELTGGSNGISGLPAVTIFGDYYAIESNNSVLMFASGLALLAVALTVILTRYFKPQFDSICEDEMLAQSVGLAVARYKIIGFCFAAGIAGLAGFALVEMLMTAHPTSFSAMSSVNYVAYAIVGGQSAILGPLLGAGVLVWAANLFSLQGEISQGLFGVVLILAVVFAKGGLIGLIQQHGVRLLAGKRRGKAQAKGQNEKEYA